MDPRPLRLIPLLLVGTSIVLAAGIERPPGPVQLPERYRAQLFRADSLAQIGRADEGLRIITALVADARARRDPGALLLLLRVKGELSIRSGGIREAEPPLREAVRLATAVHDSATLCRASRLLAASLAEQGRMSEALQHYGTALTLAVRLGSRRDEGLARTGIAYGALLRGDARIAVPEYRRAIRLLQESGERRFEMTAWIGLGRAYFELLGDFDRARKCYRAVADTSHRLDFWWSEGIALNNLGSMEYSLGDPGAAVEYFRRAYELDRAHNVPREAAVAANNLALAARDLGRFDDAVAMLERARADCDSGGFLDLEATVLGSLGRVRILQGRFHEAAGILRRAVAAADSAPVKQQAETVVALSDALARLDSLPAALAILERRGVPLRERIPLPSRLLMDRAWCQLLMASGRWAEARDRLVADDREVERARLEGFRVQALTLAARCERALGRPDSALALLQRAVRAWETERRVPIDPEWRAARGTAARGLALDLATLALEHPSGVPSAERTRTAFDLLQRFKARSLLERMRGPGFASEAPPGGAESAAVTLERMQREVLREGELLLDAYVGADTSLVFAVTRRECRALRLPGERTLGPRLRLYHDLVASPPAARAVSDAGMGSRTGEELGRLLLGGCSDLVMRSRRILFVPDGPLNLIPLGALTLDPAGDRDQPLLLRHEVLSFPSATLMAALRTRSERGPSDGSPPRILALAGASGPDGARLPGAAREVRSLGSRFEGVEVRLSSEHGASPPGERDLTQYDAIHIAAHTTVDDQHPWRSGILLASNAAPGRDPYLRAARIASLGLPARLAVLSGCESAGGRILSGEGVIGLTAAFVSAGVPTVVATLWPVDDRTTARLMERFYDALARDHTAGASLREAQAAVLSDSRTRAPFYWAGFILVGDGDARLSLRRRPNLLAWAGLGTLAAALGGGIVMAGGRRRRRTLQNPGGAS